MSFLLLSFCSTAACAQKIIRDAELNRRQEQQQEAARAGAEIRHDALTHTSPQRAGFIPPIEHPCFVIDSVVWNGAESFPWMREKEALVLGYCLGAQGLQGFQAALLQSLIDRGNLTSRVLIPQQNLATGTLAIGLLPGRIGAVQERGKRAGFTRLALPVARGELLNQRDLDQAVENFHRLPGYQDLVLDIAPGEGTGLSDIVVHHPQGSRWQGLLTLDNGGAKTTGQTQAGVILTLASPFYLYDLLTLAVNTNAEARSAAHGAHSSSLNWNMPVGYWSLMAGINETSYRQSVAGFLEPVLYTGHSHGAEIGIGATFYRSSNARSTLQAKLNRKVSRSWVDGEEIEVQYRNVTGYDLSLAHRHFLDKATLDFGIGLRGSLPHRSKAPGIIVGAPDWDGRYRILSASARLQLPAGPLRYETSLRLQHAFTQIPNTEFIAIGDRYSVRGFDGRNTLAAEHGAIWRNELACPTGGLEAFIAVDTCAAGPAVSSAPSHPPPRAR